MQGLGNQMPGNPAAQTSDQRAQAIEHALKQHHHHHHHAAQV
jgi:hypothetical protein